MPFPVAQTFVCAFSLVFSASIIAESLSEIDAQAAAITANPRAYADISEFQPQLSDEVLRLAEEVVGNAPEAIQAAQSDAYDFAGIDPSRIPQKAEMAHDEWVDVLVSRGLGEAELVSLFKRLDDSPIPVRVVFIGIAEGQKLNDAFADFGRWTKGLAHPPEGTIDPDAFTSRGVANVPRMIFMRKGQSVAEVDGLTNPSWLVEQVGSGRTGFLGRQGPTVAITERNLIDVIKERLANIDLEERKKQTVQTYWERARFYTIPPATEDRTRTIDPSIAVTKDIVDGRGNVILPAGKVVNPLHMRPFGMRLVVFNPNIEAEVVWAKSLPEQPGLRDIFMITELDRSKGWDHFNEVEDQLDSQVFTLTQDIYSRFDIRFSPTLVTADDNNFIVSEIYLPTPPREQ